MPDMKKSLRRSLLGRVLLSLISLVAILIVLEVILRIFAPVYPVSMIEAYGYDSELGTRLRPGIHLFKTTDFQEEVRVNKLGTVNFQEDFNDYKSIVFAIGDSYTQGTGLPADMSYPAQLDFILNEDVQGFYTKQYGVVNLGLAAFGGEQELIVLNRWAALIRSPEVILYLGCDNDYEDDLLFKSGYRHKHIVTGNPSWGRLVTPMKWLTNDSQIGLRLKTIFAQRRRSQVSATPKAESVAALERPVLEKLIEYAKRNKALLIVSWSDEGESYEWLKSWAKSNGIAFADWIPRFESVRESIPLLSKENQHSGGHHRGWVNRVIAKEYARQIRANKQ